MNKPSRATHARSLSLIRSTRLAILAGGLLVYPAGGDGSVQQQEMAPVGLERIFERGPLLQDRNGDGDIDFVDGRIVLTPAPSDVEVAAAANVAARLGFETTATDLPLTGRSSGVSIAIGRAGIPLISSIDIEPGVGVVSVASSGGVPGLVIAGIDDPGTGAAGLAFATRVPHLWDLDGPTMTDVTSQVRDVLAEGGVTDVQARVIRLLAADGMSGLRRLDVVVTVGADDFRLATSLLRDVSENTGEQRAGTPDTTDAALPTPERPNTPTLRFPGLHLLRLYLAAGRDTTVVHVANATASTAGTAARRPGGSSKSKLDLSSLYTNDGLLGDSDQNLIPDRVDVVLSASGDSTGATADLAARMALEATGVSIPIAIPPDDLGDPADQPPLVLIGGSHPVVQRLVRDSIMALPPLAAGQGLIQVVPKAFGSKPALIIVGGDQTGLRRAVHQVAVRFPTIWERGKDRTTIEEVETELWRAVSGRSPIGQAATAVYKLDKAVAKLTDRDLDTVDVAVHVEKADSALARFIRERLSTSIDPVHLSVNVHTIDVQHGEPIIAEEFVIPSEVDAFRAVVTERIMPRIRRGEGAVVSALLSEPPEVRADLEARITRDLVAAGASPDRTRVTILSAYKQGYSWLYDVIRPALRELPLAHLTIRFAELGPPVEWPQQAMYTPTRWLLEIFPIDEVLARELDLDLDSIAFEKMPIGSPAYEVVATDSHGTEIYRATFDPKVVLRAYFDRFPDYEMARVTTGWISARVGADSIVNERIETDLERFWDHFQSKTLNQIYDYVMQNSAGKPRATDAPHFGELRVEVTLSEPDYRVGVDMEQVASMEALHEEIYFGTLHFFDVLGRLARGQALNYPGRVIPVVRPTHDGKPGHAKITFTGFAAPRPMVVVKYRERGQRLATEQRDILPLNIEKPSALTAMVRDGQSGIERLGLRIKVDFDDDRRDEFVLRTNSRNVDGTISSAEQTTGVLQNVETLRQSGLYLSQLAFHDLGEIELAAYWGLEFDVDSQRIATLAPNGAPPAFPEVAALRPRNYRYTGGEMVQWETPIPPPEAAEIIAKMATFPQATVYQVGESYLGKAIWAMDLMSPIEASHWSQAKVSTLKPTVIYSARQHANEVSSTSHVLKLAEQLLTDTASMRALNDVNVVIHPITNPDGAQLAYDLYKITPDHMLHAGYLGSLGVDVASGQGDDDPMYPETTIRPLLWRTWLPDLFLNPHGYPSHEWVQVFSEYAGWVRTRATESRDWWGMRGWFMPSFSYVDSPDYPNHREAAFAIRDRITKAINALPEIRALNKRAYARYRRYAFDWDRENFKMDFTNDVLIYSALKGSNGQGGGAMSNPRVTIWSGTTEAPDETAHGDWLRMVASAGLAWDRSLLEYLLDEGREVDRTTTAFGGGVTFKINRPRPAKQPKDGDARNNRGDS